MSKQVKCENCGASETKNNKCAYCGSEYKAPNKGKNVTINTTNQSGGITAVNVTINNY